MRLSVAKNRPVGVALIAGYLILKAAALLLAVTIVRTSPSLQPKASEFIANVAFKVGVSLPYPTAILDVVMGLGIWLLKSWARTIIVVINGYGLCRMAVGSAILMAVDRQFLISHTSSPYFAVNLLAGVAILVYLLDPERKRLFAERS